jgi:hypothetical protein
VALSTQVGTKKEMGTLSPCFVFLACFYTPFICISHGLLMIVAIIIIIIIVARGSEMVKALCYKPKGRGFKTR